MFSPRRGKSTPKDHIADLFANLISPRGSPRASPRQISSPLTPVDLKGFVFLKPLKSANLGDVPDDIILYIFDYLESCSQTLISLSGIKKDWYVLFSRDEYWKSLLINRYSWLPRDLITKNYKNVFLCIHAHQICSRSQNTKNWWSNQMRLVVMGTGGVGKTSLIYMYVHRSFVTWDPSIEDSFFKQTQVDGDIVRLDILDTPGHEEYSALSDIYIHTGDGFVICFDVTNPRLEECENICKQICRIKDVEDNIEMMRSIPMILVGCKSDLRKDEMNKEDFTLIQKLIDTYGVQYIETSSMTGLKVNESFEILIRSVKGDTLSKQTLINMMEGKKLLSSYKMKDRYDQKMCIMM